MAATVVLSETNGVSVNVGPDYGGTTTDGISNINFGTFDTPNIVTVSHPILAGTNGWMKWLRVKVTNMGGSTNISTLKFWKSSGAYVAGEAIGGNFYPGMFNYATTIVTSYAHNTAASGAPGAFMNTPYTGDGFSVGGNGPLGAQYTAFPVPTAVTAAENIPIGGAIGGSITVAPNYSNFLLLGCLTTGATPNGAVNQKVFTLQWNEV